MHVTYFYGIASYLRIRFKKDLRIKILEWISNIKNSNSITEIFTPDSVPLIYLILCINFKNNDTSHVHSIKILHLLLTLFVFTHSLTHLLLT